MEQTIVSVGKYKFQITDNILLLREQIYSRNFKIGGAYTECFNVSITYNDNEPISAYIPYIVYDPDCSIDIPLDRGQGSIIMIKTLLRHIHKKLPTLTEVKFEDKSNIECATDYEIQTKSSRNKKKGTHVYPIPLYYFSIAFNGETWYEKHLNAKQKNVNKHSKYREKIKYLLYSEEVKTKTSFLQFLEISQPPLSIVDELENYYKKSSTFSEFFQSMPKKDRCRLVRDWISIFMSYHLNDVFENSDWIIDLPITLHGGNKKTRKYYCPKGFNTYNKSYRDFGIDITNM